MPTATSRASLDRVAYRTIEQDGLTEIAMGVVFLAVALSAGRAAFYWTYLVAIAMLGPGVQRLRARYTYPRVGYAKVPDESGPSVGRGILVWVTGSFALAALVLAATGHVTDNLAWRQATPGIGGLLAAGGLLYFAQRTGMRRHYAMAVLSVFLGVAMAGVRMSEPHQNLEIWALMMALVLIGSGAIAFRAFLRNHAPVADRTPGDG